MLSDQISIVLSDLTEIATKQEDLIREKDLDIQVIVGKIEIALSQPDIYKNILIEIIEEYKQAL
ncbi:hypothetical protein [Clostridium botulinum]|uniref:Uncharacterized protein n=1 Tax=Clostridium botulinum TaxID=1491 RepID=A0A9Q1UY81_CLOBO|nr:hypothetical protein [Clostridium botulinum]KEH97190.1 hypothetical protein Z953_02520 [Clostridium botulinum D str. 16868]KEI04700.1 hypothetical protein Y848_00630 [Clostridium botulinum C/D str. Sp77]KLU76930.1 hypothetical protein CBC3_01095 [Clostridium botulinum V891]KOA75223.1 hypothetical protein ADU78_08530 [Clostridium botulinum]KOA79003.1 hypothetical protein ADU77_04950 [Clostridium botulinum]